tara:strand:+ start:3772 stop:4077 length:306 start_codon:yes stop_codon:yes gene_type:complete
MPYTQEELKTLPFYQNLVDADEQEYLIKKELLLTKLEISGSAYDGGLLARNEDGVIQAFENPYTGELYEDETSVLYVSRVVDQLKDTDEIDGIIDRELREL